MVTLPVQMKKGIPIKQMDVGSNFQHPPHGLLGIKEIKSIHTGVLPVNNTIIIHGKQIKAMNEPMPSATLHNKSLWACGQVYQRDA